MGKTTTLIIAFLLWITLIILLRIPIDYILPCSTSLLLHAILVGGLSGGGTGLIMSRLATDDCERLPRRIELRLIVVAACIGALLFVIAMDYFGSWCWLGARDIQVPLTASQPDDPLQYKGYFRQEDAELNFNILLSGDRKYIDLWKRGSLTATIEDEHHVVSLRTGGTESGLGFRRRITHRQDYFIVWDGNTFRLFTVVDGKAEQKTPR